MAVVYLQPSLQQPTAEACAVVVVHPAAVLVIGQNPKSLDKLSLIGRQVLRDVRDVFMKALAAAANDDERELFEGLNHALGRNLFVGSPEIERSGKEPFTFALEAFMRKVVGVPEPHVSQEIPLGLSAFINTAPLRRPGEGTAAPASA